MRSGNLGFGPHWLGFATGLFLSGSALAQPAEPPPVPTTSAATPAAEPVDAEPIEAEAVDIFVRALTPQQGGLTAAQVGKRALDSSRTIEVKQSELRAADAAIDQAVAQLLPRLTLSASYTRLSDVSSSLGGGAILGAANAGPIRVAPCPESPDGCVVDSAGGPVGAAAFSIESPLDSYQLRAGLHVPLSDYFFLAWAGPKAARLGKEAARQNELAARPAVVLEANQAYYDWVRTLGQVAVAENSLANLRTRKPDVEVRFEVGKATKADKLRMEALIAGAEVTLAQARSLQELSEVRLSLLMQEAPRRYRLGDAVLTIPSAGLEQKPLTELLSVARAGRKDLAALDSQTEAMELQRDAQIASALPKLSLNGELVYANPNPRSFGGSDWAGSWSLGASLSWAYNDTISQVAGAAQTDAQVSGLKASRGSLDDGLVMQVAAARLDLLQARAALEGAEKAFVSGVEAHRVVVELYREGVGTTADIVDAEADLVRVQLNRLEAIVGIHAARANLARALGHDTVGP